MAAGATKQPRALASTRDPVTPDVVMTGRWLLLWRSRRAPGRRHFKVSMDAMRMALARRRFAG